MSFVSYSEDILKRHQSDIFDLMRELEKGGVSELRQQSALPEFQALVKKLGDLLTDPSQPAAMRMLTLKQTTVNINFDLERAQEKLTKLGVTNQALNAENIRLRGEVQLLKDRAKSLAESGRLSFDRAEKALGKISAERDDLRAKVAGLREQVASLEQMAFEAQVDTKYKFD